MKHSNKNENKHSSSEERSDESQVRGTHEKVVIVNGRSGDSDHDLNTHRVIPHRQEQTVPVAAHGSHVRNLSQTHVNILQP